MTPPRTFFGLLDRRVDFFFVERFREYFLGITSLNNRAVEITCGVFSYVYVNDWNSVVKILTNWNCYLLISLRNN